MKSDRESSTYKTRRCSEQMDAKTTSKLWLMSWNFKTIKQKISEHAIRDQQTCVTLLDMFPKLVFLSGFTVSKIFCLSKSKLSRFFFSEILFARSSRWVYTRRQVQHTKTLTSKKFHQVFVKLRVNTLNQVQHIKATTLTQIKQHRQEFHKKKTTGRNSRKNPALISPNCRDKSGRHIFKYLCL